MLKSIGSFSVFCNLSGKREDMSFLIPGFNDIIDIIIIAFLVYQALLLLKKTGSYQVLYGFILILAVYFITSFLNLDMTAGLLQSFKNLWIIVVVILFQHEIRDLLNKLNIISEFNSKLKKNAGKDFNSALIDAVSAMSFRRIGALIVIEKRNKLHDFVNAGEIIDSVMSLRLILSIFNPKSVLHDGAVIISNDRIMAAKVVLPLTKNTEFKQKFGTRHLAAIGITEVSDAIAIVVSEQTGRVSMAMKGSIKTDIAFEEMMQLITDATR